MVGLTQHDKVAAALPPGGSVTLAGLRVQVNPDGAVTVRETVPLKLPMLVMTIVFVKHWPLVIVRLLGLREMLKSWMEPGTVSSSVIERDTLPLVPVIVTVKLLGGTPLLTQTVTATLAAPDAGRVTHDGLMATAAPEPLTVAVKQTVWLNPLPNTVRILVAQVPGGMVREN